MIITTLDISDPPKTTNSCANYTNYYRLCMVRVNNHDKILTQDFVMDCVSTFKTLKNIEDPDLSLFFFLLLLLLRKCKIKSRYGRHIHYTGKPCLFMQYPFVQYYLGLISRQRRIKNITHTQLVLPFKNTIQVTSECNDYSALRKKNPHYFSPSS